MSYPSLGSKPLQFVNEDGGDLAGEIWDIGFVRYAGRRPLVLQPGKEVIISARAPRSTRERSITALVEGGSTKGLAVGRMLVDVKGGRAPVRLCNVSDHTVMLRPTAHPGFCLGGGSKKILLSQIN